MRQDGLQGNTIILAGGVSGQHLLGHFLIRQFVGMTVFLTSKYSHFRQRARTRTLGPSGQYVLFDLGRRQLHETRGLMPKSASAREMATDVVCQCLRKGGICAGLSSTLDALGSGV
ncbi:hypothetical protein EYZ11_001934 [Aspergillus tanneri]|uniref:Uncharacterized protein n=1 Tax=Aspergillus tanneri TaxID=1220188 RepID=A0A4S3JS49_9EURO|nr:hypothetical protein EYZ11_001934 [Aspergillus tanneri]